MRYRIGIENNIEGRSLAWALEHPGCFAYAQSGELALSAMPDAIVEYGVWVANRNEGPGWVDTADIELVMDESWDCYNLDENFEPAEEGYEVNAWFRYDWKPLSTAEIERGTQLLAWSRADLLDSVFGLGPAQLSTTSPGEYRSIEGILKHVAGGELWYLDRLGLAFPQEELPRDAFERLKKVRAYLGKILPSLANSKQVVGSEGEFWSPRKILRRVAWHERDHTQHIRRLTISLE